MPIAYIPKSLSTDIANIPALSISAVAQPPIPVFATSSPVKTNHWTLCVYVTPTEVVQLDPSPSGLNGSMSPTITRIELKPGTGGVKTIQLSLGEGFSVGDIIKEIERRVLDKYRFSEGGQGCRFWVHEVVRGLEEAGIVTDASGLGILAEAVKNVWDWNGKGLEEEQSGNVCGSFYG